MSSSMIRKMGPYYLLKQIGQGGMGIVSVGYKVSTDNILTQFAIKTLPHDSHTSDLVRHLKTEAKLIANLRHDSIASFYELGRDDENYYLVLEYVEGITLKKLIADIIQGQTWSLSHAIHVGCEILEGLEYLHRFQDPDSGEPREVIHGDLSPGNILLNFEGGIKLIDFGLASFQEKPNSGGYLNPHYCSPSRYINNKILRTDDIFGFGIILWEMVTHRRYYEGKESEIETSLNSFSPKDPRQINSAIPDAVAELIIKCLNAENENGYQSVSDLSHDLRDIKLKYNFTRADLRKFLSTAYDYKAKKLREMRKEHSESLTAYLHNLKSLENTDETLLITSSIPPVQNFTATIPDEIPTEILVHSATASATATATAAAAAAVSASASGIGSQNSAVPGSVKLKTPATPKGGFAEDHQFTPAEGAVSPKLVPLGGGTFGHRNRYVNPRLPINANWVPPVNWEEKDRYLRAKTNSRISLFPSRSELLEHFKTFCLFMVLCALSTILYIQREIAQDRFYTELIAAIDVMQSAGTKLKFTLAENQRASQAKARAPAVSIKTVPPLTAVVVPVPPGPALVQKPVLVSVWSKPSGAYVYVDGEKTKFITPVRMPVSVGKPVLIEVRKEGFRGLATPLDSEKPYITFDLEKGKTTSAEHDRWTKKRK
ncbi:MAG: serine/threonine-protein kinase [Bdellovibrionota bacterium]